MDTNAIIKDLIDASFKQAGIANTAPPLPPFNMDTLRAAMRQLQVVGRPLRGIDTPIEFARANGLMPRPVMQFMGIDVYESPLCSQRVPVRKHESKGRKRSDSYHRRIQKKWNKRYGFKIEHVMYMVGKNTVMMHAQEIERLKREAMRNIPLYGKSPVGVILDDMS